MKYIAEGVCHSRGYHQQRSDWFAIDDDGKRYYAFHEWCYFPSTGDIIASLYLDQPERGKDKFYYWMAGPDLPTVEDVMKHCEGCGNFRAEEHPYPAIDDDGNDIVSYFPVALDFESACKLFERDFKNGVRNDREK